MNYKIIFGIVLMLMITGVLSGCIDKAGYDDMKGYIVMLEHIDNGKYTRVYFETGYWLTFRGNYIFDLNREIFFLYEPTGDIHDTCNLITYEYINEE